MDSIRGDELTLPSFLNPKTGMGESRDADTLSGRARHSPFVRVPDDGDAVITLSDGARQALRQADQALASARAFNQSGFGRGLARQLKEFLQETYVLLGLSPDKAEKEAGRVAGRTAEPVQAFADAVPARAASQGLSMTELSISVKVETLDLRVSTESGSFSFNSTRIELSISMTHISTGEQVMQDPLAIDLDGDGISTVGLDKAVRFDLNGDGRAERTGWISGGDALLALDRNDNGVIDDGTELFGDANGHSDGLAALGDYDANGDGVIDDQDPVFGRLKLLFADGSLKSLGEVGLARLDIGRPLWGDEAVTGGKSAARFEIGMQDGSRRTGHELWFETVV